MINNLPVKTLTHKDLTIEGYSRAAVQTYWRVPELKLGFDLGAQPWSFMGTPTWFVSHTHMDHLVALPVYVARRRMMKMDASTHAVNRQREATDMTLLCLEVVSLVLFTNKPPRVRRRSAINPISDPMQPSCRRTGMETLVLRPIVLPVQ